MARALGLAEVSSFVAPGSSLSVARGRRHAARRRLLCDSRAIEASFDLVVAPDAEQAAALVARHLADAARAGGAIGLAGGSSPRHAYELAAGLQPDWGRVELWLGDERCVPGDDARSNLRLVRESLVERLAVPPRALHAVRTELAPAAAAAAYDAELREVVLDVVLLGLGSDGHTASLFPGAPSLAERERHAVAAAAGLEPWVDRVTMTLPALNAAAHVVFLAVGSAKAGAALRAFGAPPSTDTPASLVRSARGATTVVLDEAAAALLP